MTTADVQSMNTLLYPLANDIITKCKYTQLTYTTVYEGFVKGVHL